MGCPYWRLLIKDSKTEHKAQEQFEFYNLAAGKENILFKNTEKLNKNWQRQLESLCFARVSIIPLPAPPAPPNSENYFEVYCYWIIDLTEIKDPMGDIISPYTSVTGITRLDLCY